MITRAISLLSLCCLAGCALGPDYRRPEVALPPVYPEAVGQAVPVAREWWTLFGDPVLDDLVRRALSRNLDLRLAVARLDEATGLLRETGAAQYPEISFDARGERTRISQATRNPPAPGMPLAHNEREVGLGTTFELDFWGRLRRANEAARAQALASEYGKAVVEISLAGAVTQTYLALRSIDARLAVTQDTLRVRSDSVDIANARYDAGLASGLDVEQARGARAAIEAQIADLRLDRALAEHRLALLVATPDLAIEAGDLRRLPMPPLPPAGLPARLIEARPDIRVVEQELVAANARIGIARAAMFPTISLTGNVGSESAELAKLFDGSASTAGIGIGLHLPIFAAGKYTARVDQAGALQRQALAAYEQAVLNAFREVRDALAACAGYAAADIALERQRFAAEEALRIANVRYESGYSPFLEVLDAQRGANDAALAWVRNREARLAAAVDLFKALGGGWSSAEKAAP